MKGKRFLKGLLIYVCVLVVAAAAGLTFLWKYMAAYERSRPLNTAEAYVAQSSYEDWRAAVEKNVQAQGGVVFGDEQALIDRLCAPFAEELQVGRQAGTYTEEEPTFVLYGDGKVAATMRLVPDESAGKPFGFTCWQVGTVEVETDVSALLHTITVQAPSEATVQVDGIALDGSYAVDTAQPYTELTQFGSGREDVTLPTETTYVVPGVYADAQVRAEDETGTALAVSAENEHYRCAATQPSDNEAVTALCGNFIDAYVTFTSGANNRNEENYRSLCKYLVQNGALAKRMYQALDGLRWAQSAGDVIDDFSIGSISAYPGGIYVCDVSFTVSTSGHDGVVQTENHMLLLVTDSDTQPRVAAMKSY